MQANIKTLTVDEVIELLEQFSIAGLGQYKLWNVFTTESGTTVQSGVVAFEEHNYSLEIISEEDYRADLFKEQYELLTDHERLSEFSYQDSIGLTD